MYKLNGKRCLYNVFKRETSAIDRSYQRVLQTGDDEGTIRRVGIIFTLIDLDIIQIIIKG